MIRARGARSRGADLAQEVPRDRRRRRRGALGVGGGAAVFARDPSRPPRPTRRQRGDEELVLYNGRIHTMDAQNRIVSRRRHPQRPFRRGRQGHRPGTAAPIDLEAAPSSRASSSATSTSSASRTGPATTHPREHDVDRRGPAALAARRPDVPDGQWITVDRRLPPEPVGRAPHADARRARRSRARPAGAPLHALHRPVRDEQPRQGVLRRGRRGPSPPRLRQGEHRRRRPHRRGQLAGGPSNSALYHLRTLQTFDDKKRSTLDAMAYSAQVGLTAYLDDVLFPTPGPAPPDAGALEPRPLPDVRLVARAAPRGQDLRPAADELPPQPERSSPAGAEGAAEQPVPVLRRRHDDDRLDRRVGCSASALARSGWRRSGWWRRPAGGTRTASAASPSSTQVVNAYETVNAEFGIAELRWMVHHVRS